MTGFCLTGRYSLVSCTSCATSQKSTSSEPFDAKLYNNGYTQTVLTVRTHDGKEIRLRIFICILSISINAFNYWTKSQEQLHEHSNELQLHFSHVR